MYVQNFSGLYGIRGVDKHDVRGPLHIHTRKITGDELTMRLVGSFAPIHRDRDLGVPLPINYYSTQARSFLRPVAKSEDSDMYPFTKSVRGETSAISQTTCFVTPEWSISFDRTELVGPRIPHA